VDNFGSVYFLNNFVNIRFLINRTWRFWLDLSDRAGCEHSYFFLSLHHFLPTHCRWVLHTITLSDINSVELLWMRDRPFAETSTSQHTTLIRDRNPWRRRDSNPQSQQVSGRPPTP